MPQKRGLYPKQMSDSWACSKERCFDVSLEQSKKKEYGKNYIIMNYTKNLMNQTLLTMLKLKDWHRQGTWCIWIMIEPLKKYSTPNQMG